MIEGDFLRPHTDDNRNRQLALVIYLSAEWENRLGGVLHVIDKANNDAMVPPAYNSLVAFDVLTDTQHFVTPITPEAGTKARLTIGGWYHKAGA